MSNHSLQQWPRSRTTWAIALIMAATLHASAACYAISSIQSDDVAAEDVGGLVVVDFAPVVSSADSFDENATLSEESVTAASSPEVEQKMASADAPETPPAESPPHEAPPDLQLSLHKTLEQQERPDEAPPTEANEATQAPSRIASAASGAAAPPPSLQQNASTESPTEGSTAHFEDAPASWRRTLVAHLAKHKRYPSTARSQRLEGEVAVRFKISRAGKLVSADVLRSSGHAALDEAALELLRRAQPMPTFPASMRSSELELVAPINFRLK